MGESIPRLVYAFVFAMAVGLALPGMAERRAYSLNGDSSNYFPTDGTVLRPGGVSGTAVIEDTGNGSPTLESLEISVYWRELVGGPGVPTALVGANFNLSAAGNQVGTGSTTSAIQWGTLTGFTSTGYLTCRTIDCGDHPCAPGEEPPERCIPFFGFEGIGPLPPLSATGFDSDPWMFSGDSQSFAASPIEYVNLAGGVVTYDVVWRGVLTQVPALPLIGGSALALGLLFGAARAFHARGREDPQSQQKGLRE